MDKNAKMDIEDTIINEKNASLKYADYDRKFITESNTPSGYERLSEVLLKKRHDGVIVRYW